MGTFNATISIYRGINSMGRKCYILRTTNSAGKVVFEDFELLENALEKMRGYLIESSCFKPTMHDSLDIVIKKTFFQ